MVNDTMYVRQMTEADWPQVAAIYEQGIVSHKATFAQKAPEYAVWDVEHHPHTRLVAETSDGIIAGWVAVAPSFARAVYNGVAEISIYIQNIYNSLFKTFQILHDFLVLVLFCERQSFFTPIINSAIKSSRILLCTNDQSSLLQ